MKTSILLLLLFIGCSCFGQGEKPAFDTTRVLMQVCDTLHYRPAGEGSKTDTIPVTYFTHPPIWWQFGYSITKTQWVDSRFEKDDQGMPIWNPGGFETIFVGYLDENKKALQKNIVVWDSKEIKK